jgi:predicted permease
MDVSARAAYFVIDLLLPLAVGYLCRRQGGLDEDFFQRMMKLAIIIVYPILALLGFWATRLDFELMLLPVLGIVMSVIPGVIAYFRAKAKYADPLDQGSYVLSASLSNTITSGASRRSSFTARRASPMSSS